MMLFIAVLCFIKNVLADSQIVLTVLPFGKSIVLEENADLNLTCKVKSQGRPPERYDLSWKLPTRSTADGDRITIYEIDDQLTITIHNLQEDDSGLYVCELQHVGIIRSKKITVFVRSKKCGKHFFDCGNGVCVPKHYVCDGYVDCPSGYDESYKHCGPDACHGKILCDGRCIPKEFCCDPAVDINCTVSYVMPCCTGFLHPGQNNYGQSEKQGYFLLNAGLHRYGTFTHRELNPIPCSATVDCHFGRIIGFGNSIIYIVASCAVVVIVVSAVVMFLACRICSQRSEELHRLSRISDNEFQQHLSSSVHHRDIESIENMDAIFDDTGSDHGNEVTENFMLMSYEDGTLINFSNCGPKPPPYTESAVGIPPPPYESMVDIPSIIKDNVLQEENANSYEPNVE